MDNNIININTLYNFIVFNKIQRLFLNDPIIIMTKIYNILNNKIKKSNENKDENKDENKNENKDVIIDEIIDENKNENKDENKHNTQNIEKIEIINIIENEENIQESNTVSVNTDITKILLNEEDYDLFNLTNVKNVNDVLSLIEFITRNKVKVYYDKCFKIIIFLLNLMKKNEIKIELDIYSIDYEIEYLKYQNIDIDDTFLNSELLISEFDNKKNYELYNFKSFGNIVQLYTIINNENNFCIYFRQSDSFNDWINNYKFLKMDYSLLFKEANNILKNKKSDKQFDLNNYKNIYTHDGFTSSFLMKSDMEDDNKNNLIEFLIHVINLYEKLDIENKKIIISGHSLGGALTLLSSFFINEYIKLENFNIKLDIITTGAPNLGNKCFCDLFEKNIINNKNIELYKISKYGDYIIDIPSKLLFYQAINSEILIKNNNDDFKITCYNNKGVIYDFIYFFRTLFSYINYKLNCPFICLVDSHDLISYFIDFIKLYKNTKTINCEIK